MSSGRDVYLEGWSQEQKTVVIKPKTHLERMKDYKETILAELDRLTNHIKDLEDEEKKK